MQDFWDRLLGLGTGRRQSAASTGWRRAGRSLAHLSTVWILFGILLGSAPAAAKNHQWKFNEFFSNADGTVQYIEMKESAGSDFEFQTSGAWIDTLAPHFSFHSFGQDLVPPTGNKTFLAGTAGYAALPGAPAPDFIIPDAFFDPSVDETIRYRFGMDIVVLAAGTIPTDGTHSVDRDGVVAVNSPENFAGETGSIRLSSVPALAPVGVALLVATGMILGGVSLRRFRSQSGD